MIECLSKCPLENLTLNRDHNHNFIINFLLNALIRQNITSFRIILLTLKRREFKNRIVVLRNILKERKRERKLDMNKPKHPLAEVFGHLAYDFSAKAQRYRSRHLCPFSNKVPNCTKDKAKDPLGVCCIFHESDVVITCPIRFREEWLITDDAASFFFHDDTSWSSLTEVRLNDANGKSAGNIDVVLVAYDANGKVFDFGALEIQAVYISGNIRDPFAHYMENPKANSVMDWTNQPNYPRPDYLSSSRKRLAPQLLFKGGILHSWKKKIAVALNKSFFDTLPRLKTVQKSDADIAWLIYDLKLVKENGREMYKLTRIDEVYTEFESSLISITTPIPGKIDDFIKLLQSKLDEQIENPPINKTIERPF